MCTLEALCPMHYLWFTNLWCGYYFPHFIDKDPEDHRLNNLPEAAVSTWHQLLYFHHFILLLEPRILKGRKKRKWEFEREGERSESFQARARELCFRIMGQEPLRKLFCFRRILWLAKLGLSCGSAVHELWACLVLSADFGLLISKMKLVPLHRVLVKK